MFKGFFTAKEFEQRSRERERRKLIEELEEIDKRRRYCDAREPIATARLAELARRDLSDLLDELRGAKGAQRLGRANDPTTWSPHRQAYEAIGQHPSAAIHNLTATFSK